MKPRAQARQVRDATRPPVDPPRLDRFSLRARTPEVTQGWRALDLPWFLAPFVYAFRRAWRSRTARILVIAAALTPCLVLATIVGAGFDEAQRMVRAHRKETKAFESRGDTTVLVLGTDDVPGEGRDTAPGRSDTLMLVNIQYNAQRLRLMSIPRDTFVMVDYGRGPRGDKIAHAYRRGGIQKSLEAVRRLTRLKIDHYVTIDYGLFRSFIDRIGGVPVEIEKRMHYEDKAGGLYIDFQPGFHILDGQKSLEYVRFRKDGLGDIGRIARQQKFLKAAVTKVLDPRVLKGLVTREALTELMAHLDTNFQPSQVLPLAMRFFDASADVFEARVFPGEHHYRKTAWTGSKALSYFFVDWEEADGILDTWFASEARVEPSEEAAAEREADRALQARLLAPPEGAEEASGEGGDDGGEGDEDDAGADG